MRACRWVMPCRRFGSGPGWCMEVGSRSVERSGSSDQVRCGDGVRRAKGGTLNERAVEEGVE